MNDMSATSAPGASLLPEGTAAITTMHLIVMAVFAILVIAGILWGVRLKRTRVQAQRDVRSNAEESGMPPAVVSIPETEAAPPPPTPAPAAPPTPVPVAPAPAPIADAPVMGVPDAPAAAPLATEAASTASAEGSVTQLKGLGPKVATRLAELGVTTVGQMAALSQIEAQALDAQLGSFTGRMTRDRWIEQAKFLAAGDTAGFEALFGKL